MTASLHIILDTDPGIDDAAAIAAALFAPQLDLQLITTVAGNVSVEKRPVMRCSFCISGTAISHLRKGRGTAAASVTRCGIRPRRIRYGRL